MDDTESELRTLVAQVRNEYADLAAFLAALEPESWQRRTIFFGWSVADEVMHLHLIDEFGLTAIRDPAAFAKVRDDVRVGQKEGVELSDVMRERFGGASPAILLASWKETYEQLLDALERTNPDTRMPWFGPEIRIASFAASRQMEVWAHGQDIYDLLSVRRRNDDRIRNICDLGVRTQGWSFRNRGLERPPPPRVSLIGPSGAEWIWNPDGAQSVSGPANDFALVVTQRRHVDDTSLLVAGEGARRWMEIAQCFAGDPQDGPPPGGRAVIFERDESR